MAGAGRGAEVYSGWKLTKLTPKAGFFKIRGEAGTMGACAETIGRRRVRLEDVVVGLTIAKSGLMGNITGSNTVGKGFRNRGCWLIMVTRRRGDEEKKEVSRRGAEEAEMLAHSAKRLHNSTSAPDASLASQRRLRRISALRSLLLLRLCVKPFSPYFSASPRLRVKILLRRHAASPTLTP